MHEQSGGIRASMVKELGRPNVVYGRGRVCAADECETRISMYNKASFCYAHTPLTFPVMRGRRRKRGDLAAEAA